MKDYQTIRNRLNRLADRCHYETMAANNPKEMLRWSKRFIRLNAYMREYVCAYTTYPHGWAYAGD